MLRRRRRRGREHAVQRATLERRCWSAAGGAATIDPTIKRGCPLALGSTLQGNGGRNRWRAWHAGRLRGCVC